MGASWVSAGGSGPGTSERGASEQAGLISAVLEAA